MDMIGNGPGTSSAGPCAGGSGSPARPTARRRVPRDPRERRRGLWAATTWTDDVLVQGAGGVGAHLAGLLGDAGASVLVTDVDRDRARDGGGSHQGEAVPPDQVLDAPCDVFSPCAIGGVLPATPRRRLSCRIVAGSANNQLAEPVGRGGAARAGDPLCARLRRQRRWSDRGRGARAARVEPVGARRGADRDRRHAARDLPRGRHARHVHGGGRRRSPCSSGCGDRRPPRSARHPVALQHHAVVERSRGDELERDQVGRSGKTRTPLPRITGNTCRLSSSTRPASSSAWTSVRLPATRIGPPSLLLQRARRAPATSPAMTVVSCQSLELERRRRDVLGHRVDLLGHRALALRPGAVEALVGDAAEQQDVGGELLLELVGAELVAEQRPDPAGVRRSRARRRAPP